ncbi:MAG: hypothetical protein KDD02_00510 [Phaeodactylibacter sp.]|nr:hypothetical protein [Phaeodactylibacter sp.]MCB9299496.1 hypothetical protein [Lewinellaceae bacterium]
MPFKYLLGGSAFLVLVLATACQRNSEDQKKPQLFAELFVRYLEAERELKATATFFEGDSIQTASPKTFSGGVSFQGSGMEARPLPGGVVRYTLQQNADYSAAFPFRFPSNNGQKQEYTLAMLPIDTFYIIDGKASKSQGMSLYAQGGQLQAGESLVFLFNDANNRAYSFTLEGPTNGEEYRISAQQLEGLEPGPHQLYLVRKKRMAEKKPGVSILADVEFYTRLVEVEVEQ